MLGKFKNNLPHIEIEVKGLFGGKSEKFEAIVDTGNNTYLQLPYVKAFPLGLRLDSVEDGTTLADGSKTTHFVCRGMIVMDGKEIETTIDIFPQCPILIGTALLKLLNKQLLFDIPNGRVEMTDSNPREDVIDFEE
jgi:predicted aspartyl protease